MNNYYRFSIPAVTLLSLGLLAAGTNIVQAADGPSDAQIVGIVLAANTIDINYGQIALKTSKDKAVREFAQRMVTDHSAVQQSVIDLAAKLGVTAEDSSTSDGLKQGAVAVTAKLNALQGKAFDSFYVDNEVSYHASVTGAVESVLIPSARNAELKAALVGSQALFLRHLEHAKMIQAARSTPAH